MAKIKTFNSIEKVKGKINPLYDISWDSINDILQDTTDKYEIICNAFLFGYSQGAKAQKRGRAYNG